MALSPTLAINQEISRRREAGLPVVALGFGEASIPVHPSLVDRLSAHAAEGAYGPVAGIPALLEAAAERWSRHGVPTRPGQVVGGPGTKPLLFAIFEALGGPVLLPRPSWVSYAAQNRILGQPPELVPTLDGQGGVPDPDLLDAAAARLREQGRPASAVLVTIPDNPTGTVASPEVVRALCEVAERHDLVVISDEIYLDLVHDDRQVLTPGQVIPDRTITTTGLSKNLAVGGWRIGVARFPARLDDLREHVTGVASEIWSAPAHPVQSAAAWALTEPAVLQEHIRASRELHGRMARAVAGVFRAAGADAPEPSGGFYLYPDLGPRAAELTEAGITTSPELAHALLERHGVVTLPGVAFGDVPERLTLRVALPMLYGTDDEQRLRAMHSEHPEELPWIVEGLEAVSTALRDLGRPAS